MWPLAYSMPGAVAKLPISTPSPISPPSARMSGLRLAMYISGIACGSKSSLPALNLISSPSSVTRSPFHSCRIRPIPSRIPFTGLGLLMVGSVSKWLPAPITTRKRPGASSASVAQACADRAGWRV